MKPQLCGKPVAWRFTWPGREESVICDHCAPKLAGVAKAIGFQLQLQPILPEQQNQPCPQQVTQVSYAP